MPVLEALERTLGFSHAQKAQTLIRSDAGFGGDANVNNALQAGWQVLAKGKGGRRPNAYAREVADAAWHALGHDRWVAVAVNPPTYVRPTQHLVLRWRTETGRTKYSTVVCSIMDWPLAEIIFQYDDRGACETEIQADKAGLKLERRRKKQLAAQEALILLTDLAHNLLAWTRHWMFPEGPLATFGTTRLIEDVFAIPGRLVFRGDQLTEVHLNALHPYAQPTAAGLQRLLAHFSLA
ncbi:MAG TPA: transposase [Ardenticatenaceae bacterium]|nr:transposase [Ardenticatenaceae bacterium]